MIPKKILKPFLVKNSHTKQVNKLTLLIISLLFIISITRAFTFLDMPFVISDEMGYFNNAAGIAGEIFEGKNKYSFGYSLVIAPFFLIFDSVIDIYNANQILLKFLCLISILLIFISIKYLYKNETSLNEKIGLSITCVSYPSYIIYSNLTLSEVWISFLVLVILLQVLLLLHIDKLKNGFFYLFSIPLLSTWLIYSHVRTINIFLISLFLVVVITSRLSKSKWEIFCALAFLTISTISFSLLLDSFIAEGKLNLYGGFDRQKYSDNINYINRIKRIFNFQFYQTFVGQLNYLVISTAGLFMAFALSSLQIASKIINRSKLTKTEQFHLFVFLTWFLGHCISVGFMAGGNRGDHLIYGRYNEVLAIPIILLGYNNRQHYSYGLMVKLILALCFTTYFVDIPAVDNVLNLPLFITSFWPQSLLGRGDVIMGLLFVIPLMYFMYRLKSNSLALIILSTYFLFQTIVFTNNWIKPNYDHFGESQLYTSTPKGVTVVYDCNDFYLPENKCNIDNYKGCFNWLFEKYSTYFSLDQIKKLDFDQWLSSNEDVFLTSSIFQKYESWIYNSENTVPGTMFAYSRNGFIKREKCFLPYCYKWHPTSNDPFLDKGAFTNGRIYGNQLGTVKYGPYYDFTKGHYRLRLYGEYNVRNGMIIDVTSDYGTKLLDEEVIVNLENSGLIYESTIALDTIEKSVVFRVALLENSEVYLDSLIFEKID